MPEGYRTISREELKAKIDHRVKFTLIEVLSRDAFDHAHLPMSINIPVADLRIVVRRLIPTTWEDIVVYGDNATADDAERAARELVAMGYKNVKVYAGGKQDWIDAGYPVERSHRHEQVA